MAPANETTSLEGNVATRIKQHSTEIPHSIPLAHERQLLHQLVMKIKDVMRTKPSESDEMEKLVMIDAIQRLGLEYYFRDEIHAQLEKWSHIEDDGDNLHDVALRFRLLRQAGYFVQGCFSKFMDKEGKFKSELEKDTKGLMSLFEACELSTPSDTILDEATEFTWNLLKTTSKNVENSEAMIINNTLNNPHHKSLPRLTAKNQLRNFEMLFKSLHFCSGANEWIKDIVDLAKVDIKVSQIYLQTEIAQVSRWWKDLGMTDTLELARNQPAKWHMWSSVALPGPDMAEIRTELTKPISFIYIIDDIFDVYGELEDLTLFTEAVNKWDYANINGLPNYMKICLKALYETTNDMTHKIYVKYGWDPKDCLQQAWAELCNAFLVEARWFRSGHFPATEEYLRNGIISTGVFVVYASLFSLLGEATNHKCAHLWNSYPGIVTSAGTLLRLWDDLGSAKDENQDGHDGSFVACYINEHHGSTDDTARKCVLAMISDAWKNLNEECMSHSPFSFDFKTAFLNLARMIPIMYKYDDNHRLPSLEKHMKSLLDE